MNTGIPLFPEQASSLAQEVDLLYFFLIAVSVFFTILIVGVLIFFIVRYKRRSDADRPEEVHGNTLLEITWSVIPLLLTMIMFGWGVSVFYKKYRPPADAMEILVTGKQWMWKLQHPSGRSEINELHVPLGQPIKLTMTSEDVIHSFYIPAFRVKSDVLPGRYTTLWFKPTKLGRYHLFCAEYCGTEHSRMRGSVYVLTPHEYERWASGIAAAADVMETPVAAGERLFAQLGCVTCHAEVSGALGPSLQNLHGHEVELTDGSTVIADDDYIRESILQPNAKVVAGYQPIMPTFRGLVNETQMMQILSYIKSLSDTADAGSVP